VTQQHNDCLGRLQQLGVRIAIDDFGTGYSSLNYLTTYPVNRLKIAQPLVFRFDSDARNATVVRAAIRLAHDLGIECIAEGVETQAQAKFLVSAVASADGLLLQPAGRRKPGHGCCSKGAPSPRGIRCGWWRSRRRSGNTVIPDNSSKSRIESMHYVHNAAVFYYNCAGGGDQMESNQILGMGLSL
jgi:hypothetical protein